MSVIDIDLAMRHLLAEPDDQVLIQAQLDAAEDAASRYLQRRFFADDAALIAATSAVTGQRLAARTIYDASLLSADDIENTCDRDTARQQARQVFLDASARINAIALGIVINPSISAACLLKLGHLFANREEVVTGVSAVELPLASQNLLMPYRIGMGI